MEALECQDARAMAGLPVSNPTLDLPTKPQDSLGVARTPTSHQVADSHAKILDGVLGIRLLMAQEEIPGALRVRHRGSFLGSVRQSAMIRASYTHGLCCKRQPIQQIL